MTNRNRGEAISVESKALADKVVSSLHAGVATRSDERKKLERLSDGGPADTSVGQPLRKSGFR